MTGMPMRIPSRFGKIKRRSKHPIIIQQPVIKNKVYSRFQLAGKYLHYYRHASNAKGHGMHSPFVFDFIQHVLQNRSKWEIPSRVQQLRSELLTDRRKIAMKDLGAGSVRHTSKPFTVAHIARTALKPEKYAGVLYRMVKHYQPRQIVELGTSLGITTAGMAVANPDAVVTTLEGNPSVAAIAQENFNKLDLPNIRLCTGNFDDLLQDVVDTLPSVDLVFIDGNHRYAPTMEYFQTLLGRIHTNTILVFDDIHWSSDMEKAWMEICAHPDVAYTIDIFFLGFVFFRKEFRVKQNFSIRF
jgi:predicted O-methyltransferase YrrM